MHWRLLAAGALTLGLVGLGNVATVSHAANVATINTITAAPVPPGGKVKVAPNVSLTGDVKLVKKYFTIWKSTGKKLVNKKKSAWLAAGSYQVKTTATYLVKKRGGGYYKPRTITRTQPLTVVTTTVTCATQADAQRVRVGDTKQIVSWKLYSTGTLDYRSGKHEDWRYTVCDNDVQWIWVSYRNGKVTDVWGPE